MSTPGGGFGKSLWDDDGPTKEWKKVPGPTNYSKPTLFEGYWSKKGKATFGKATKDDGQEKIAARWAPAPGDYKVESKHHYAGNFSQTSCGFSKAKWEIPNKEAA